MDERIYVSAVIPYGELTHAVPDPRGERLAPGSLRTAPGRALRLYLAHGGDRSHYRIPAGLLHDARQERAGLELCFELHRTAEGRRARENAADSTMAISPELYVLRDRTGGDGERYILDAILHGVALTADPAYGSARVTAIQTATERRTARLNAVAAMLEHGKAAALEARKYAPAPDVAALLAVKWDPALAEQHTPAAKLALLAHRW